MDVLRDDIARLIKTKAVNRLPVFNLTPPCIKSSVITLKFQRFQLFDQHIKDTAGIPNDRQINLNILID